MSTTPNRRSVTGNSLTRAAIDRAELEELRITKLLNDHKIAGDMAFEAGNFETAAKNHKKALELSQSLIPIRETLTQLRADLEDPADREDARARWMPNIVTTHNGVGEGDSGLPDDMIPATPGFTIPESALMHEDDEKGFGRKPGGKAAGAVETLLEATGEAQG
jgi:hypothetical protein